MPRAAAPQPASGDNEFVTPRLQWGQTGGTPWPALLPNPLSLKAGEASSTGWVSQQCHSLPVPLPVSLPVSLPCPATSTVSAELRSSPAPKCWWIPEFGKAGHAHRAELAASTARGASPCLALPPWHGAAGGASLVLLPEPDPAEAKPAGQGIREFPKLLQQGICSWM